MAADQLIVSSTVDSERGALELASSAVEAGLGACAQVVGPITSVYRWQGEVQTDQEWRVEIKTTAGRAPELVEHLKAKHGYDLPEIIATPIEGGSAEYLRWLADETR
ncbi:divalent-cation tolerance protein CutA [Amycolatopsis nigrescens]|uniref:divalent-cation tolerance protein CutA n=1 Tax=Amycolatopsis nigrescens TaxID=381445 RepID=UPI00037350BC|nr:divalent-cation tolerance protein CutA [Amycolatopsis nigrescens]